MEINTIKNDLKVTQMLDPKIFYKKLDAILNRIFEDKTEEDFLYSILEALEKSFGKSLNFSNGRIYKAHTGGFFELYYPEKDEKKYAMTISVTSQAVSLVLLFGMYIFDDEANQNEFRLKNSNGYSVPVVFTVKDDDRHCLFVYDLKDGWIREEIEFCFNAVRSALNMRIYTDNIENEIIQAASIQRSLLPRKAPRMENFEIAFRSEAAEFIVGDLYDFYTFDSEYIGVGIGDVSGHGLPSALLVRDVVTGLRMGLAKEMKMVYTMRKLNQVIHQSTFSSRFVSLFYGEFDKTGHLIYVNAGHPPPILVFGGEVSELPATGTFIGALPDIDLYRSYTYLDIDSVLVLYSDGIFERTNLKGEQFGLDRLKKLIKENQKECSQIILKRIFSAVFEFGNREKWNDDTTLIIIKRIA